MTRCEIIIREKKTDKTKPGITIARPDIYAIELFKGFDGDYVSMEKYLLGFAEWVQEDERSLSVMRDANLMSSLLIAYDWEFTKRTLGERIDKYPDVRPRGEIASADYLYLVDLPNAIDVNDGIVQLRVRTWPIEGHNDDWTSLILKGKAPPKSRVVREKIVSLEKVEERIRTARKDGEDALVSPFQEQEADSPQSEPEDEKLPGIASLLG